ncbi:MAG: hypothetical protein IJV96_01200 [Clostridia bacterium]|nr:hypothetical protein [Clostridia bacterium]
MKKTLSLILVLCMLVTACFVFSSCSQVTIKDAETNTQSVLSEAMKNTMSGFFSGNADTSKIIKKALTSGSLTVGFEGNEDLLGEDVKVLETIYSNQKDKEYVSDTTVTFGGETLNARIFLDKTGIAFNSQALLGSDRTLAINVATLAEKFETSALKELILPNGAEEEELAQIVQMLGTLKTEYEALFADASEENLAEEINEIYALMGRVVSEETVEMADGKSADCVVITYTLTNATLKELAEKILAKANLTGDQKTDAEAALDEAIAEINKAVSFALTEKIYINQKTNKVVKETINGTVVRLDEEDSNGTVDVELVFGDTEIKLMGTFDVAGTTATADITLTKEEKNGSEAYKLVVNAGDGKGAVVNFLNVTYTYTKSTGAIVVAADLYGEEERATVTLNGSMTTDKTEAKIEFTSLVIDEETYNFKVSLTFNKEATMPDRPADTKDIMVLTAEEWEALAQEIAEGKLADLIG